MSDEATLDKFLTEDQDTTDEQESEQLLPEISDIPEDWNLVTVEDVSKNILGGGTPAKNNKEYWGGDIPWASVKDLNGIELSVTEDYITEAGVENSATNVVPSNSVIVSARMTVGEPFLNQVEMAINQDMKAIIPDTDRVVPWFLVYSLWDKDPYLKSLGRGTTVDGITTKDLTLTHLGLPPLNEQRKIASVLYTVDQASDKIEDIIRQGNRVKKGLIQKLYSEGYFDHEKYQEVDKQDAYVMTRADEVPAEWEIRQLDEIAEIKTGHTPSTSVDEYWDGNISWVDIHDLTQLEKTVIETTDDTITEEGLENSGAKLLPKGTLVLCRTGAIGETAILGKEMATDQDQVTFECDESVVLPRYLMYLFEFATPQLERLSAGSTHDKIQLHFFSDLEIPLPSIDEQHKIVDALESIDDVVIANKEQLDRLDRRKTGLRQDLISGDVRTAGEEIDIPDEVKNYEPE